MQVNNYEATEFKDTEIGKLPSDWTVDRLGNVAKTTSGGTPDRKRLDFFGGNIHWVKSGELKDALISSTEEMITDEGLKNSNAKLFSPGTLLIAMYGATAGKTALLRIQAATNQAVCAIFPHADKILSSYLMYYFILRRNDLLKQRYGGAQPNISQQILRDFLVAIPPPPEQRRIATVLNAIQADIAAQEDIIAAAREFKRTLMQRLFTYGAGAEPAVTKETEIGEVPIHWEVKSVSRIASKVQYGFTESATWDDTGVKFLRITDITDRGVLWSTVPYCYCPPDQIPKYSLQENDIVFARTGATTGKSFLVKDCPLAVFASYLIRLRVNRDVSPDYVYNCFNTSSYWRQITMTKTGATQPGINGTKLRDIHIPIPSTKGEQEQIAMQLSLVNEKIDVEEDRNIMLQSFFKTMLHQLMTGQIRLVSDEGLPSYNFGTRG